MIKFAFFETDASYQCHFAEIGMFVVSIAHYMRAYFNYQALLRGEDFELPGDVGYLNVSKKGVALLFQVTPPLLAIAFFTSCVSVFSVHSTTGYHL